MRVVVGRDDPLVEPLEFRVAGMKHVPPDSRGALVVGATLKFEREPSKLGHVASFRLA